MPTFYFVSKGVSYNYLWRYRERLIPNAYQEKISTVWAACEKQHLNLTWILVLFAFSKTDFLIEKKIAFSIQTGFMCLDSAVFCETFFRFRRNLIWCRKKKPRIIREQNTCPWHVKERFKSLTWFCSLAGECLDHSTEKGSGSVNAFFSGLWL